MEDGGQRQDNKTWETNCHVEGCFAIVKQHILMKARRLRAGRYIEHIMQHGFSLKLLQKPLNLNDIQFAEEAWAKKDRLTSSKMGDSKFYSVPTSVPHPKRKQSRKSKRHAEQDIWSYICFQEEAAKEAQRLTVHHYYIQDEVCKIHNII